MKTRQNSASVALTRLLVTIEAMRRVKAGQRAEEALEIQAVRCEHCQSMVTPEQAKEHPCWSR
jgi:hypothetical protein